MRHLRHLIVLLPGVIPLACAIAFPAHPADPSFHPQPYPSLPFQPPPDVPRTQHDQGRWAYWRDRVIRLLWNVRPTNAKSPMAASTPPTSSWARYGGDVVLRFRMQSEAEAAALAEAVTVLMLDVWEFTAEWVDVRLSKDVVPSLLSLLPSSLQRAHTPLMHDLPQAISDSYPSVPSDAPRRHAPGGSRAFSHAVHTPAAEETNIVFRTYQPLSVLIPWMRLLTSLFPTHVRMISVGVSYEGRDIHALRVGVHPTNSERPSAPRKTIIIAGGSHAREWISTSTVAYVAYSLITEYGKTPGVTKLLEEFDWVFIPTLNPDGYVYTWETDRLWRKNRQETSIRFCKGVDLDRGYGFEWDGDSPGNNPCSESFAGDTPFEAVESRQFASWVRNETEQNRAKFVGFLDFHSYSQQVLYPYSYSCISSPPSLENLEELAIGLAKAIRLTNGVQYGVTSACEGSVTVEDGEQHTPERPHDRDGGPWPRMETGGGSALDWFYHEIGVHYAYQIKLRDTGSYGFLLPSAQIVPTGKEALSAVRYFGEFLLSDEDIEMVESRNRLQEATQGAPEAGRAMRSAPNNRAGKAGRLSATGPQEVMKKEDGFDPDEYDDNDENDEEAVGGGEDGDDDEDSDDAEEEEGRDERDEDDDDEDDEEDIKVDL